MTKHIGEALCDIVAGLPEIAANYNGIQTSETAGVLAINNFATQSVYSFETENVAVLDDPCVIWSKEVVEVGV